MPGSALEKSLAVVAPYQATASEQLQSIYNLPAVPYGNAQSMPGSERHSCLDIQGCINCAVLH